MTSQKQLFISHSHTDVEIIQLFENRLKTTFDGRVNVFVTALGDSIQPGEDWFETIQKTIQKTNIALFVLTPRSIERNWVWLEMGAFWQAHAEGRLWMVPLLVGLTPGEIPQPINRLQAVDLTDVSQLERFWYRLKERVGLPNTKNIKYPLLAKSLSEANKRLVEQNRQQSDVDEIDRLKTNLVRGLHMSVQSGDLSATGLSLFEQLALITLAEIRQIRREAPR
jgi:hypothetical protein